MASIIRATTTSGLQVAPDNSGSLQLQTNGTTAAVTIDTSQNVGIGTASPSVKLEIAGGVSAQQVAGRYYGFGTGGFSFDGTTVNDYGITYTTISSTFNTVVAGYSNIKFATNQTERMRIDSSGNVLVGTTSTILSNTKFNLSSSQAAALGGMGFVNTGASTKKWQIGPDGNGNFVVFNDAAAGVYVSYGGTSWTANSDERLKTDLKPIENATEKVSTIRSVTGRYKTDEEGTSRAFLIAQDVQKVLPEAVNVQNDEQGTLGVAYTEVIPLLVAAIKEQQTIINDLKARVETLEAK